MEIILRQDVDSLGLAGDTVKVADGHARNYLIPKGIALECTKNNLKMMEMQRRKIEINRLKAIDDAEKIKNELSSVKINIFQKAGEEGKLYGSVTSMDIAEELEKQGITIDRRKIILDKSIKTLGEFNVSIKLYHKVTGIIKVTVKALEE